MGPNIILCFISLPFFNFFNGHFLFFYLCLKATISFMAFVNATAIQTDATSAVPDICRDVLDTQSIKFQIENQS